MTGQDADGMCVCGRAIPPEFPSDWACSEPCQSAWLHHQADPEYPHPRDIRAAADARATAAETEIDIGDGLCVRVGTPWRVL